MNAAKSGRADWRQRSEWIGGGFDYLHVQAKHEAADEHHAAGDEASGEADERLLPCTKAKRSARGAGACLHLAAGQVDRLWCAGGARGVQRKTLGTREPFVCELKRCTVVLAQRPLGLGLLPGKKLRPARSGGRQV